MSQYAFYLDMSRCTGCKTCVVACKDAYGLDVGVAFRRVYEVVGGSTTKDEAGCISSDCIVYYMSLSCNHCAKPVCVEVCPTRAMHKDPDTGFVSVDTEKCIGCGYCHLSCPYSAPQVDPRKGHSVKCHGCAESVLAGDSPVCVLSCPARALQFGPLEQMREKGVVAEVAPLPPASHTLPHLFVTPCRDAQPSESDQVVVGNSAEVQ
ncbi:4Fe-4S dicluster domain-containing protein [Adlercreutzia agrestimuris]|uniref:4Fe-4S dicluster domain-containing protein n=1 Tax=Adlercreutzia agrestimuris TaxID=2941324 RepID=UPI00203F204F|nr:4Fe-4S dicluster domain-containing protein [Adlercreutzia agrestimuris]